MPSSSRARPPGRFRGRERIGPCGASRRPARAPPAARWRPRWYRWNRPVPCGGVSTTPATSTPASSSALRVSSAWLIVPSRSGPTTSAERAERARQVDDGPLPRDRGEQATDALDQHDLRARAQRLDRGAPARRGRWSRRRARPRARARPARRSRWSAASGSAWPVAAARSAPSSSGGRRVAAAGLHRLDGDDAPARRAERATERPGRPRSSRRRRRCR